MGEEVRVLRRRALVSPRAVLRIVEVRLDRRICRHLSQSSLQTPSTKDCASQLTI